MNEDNGDNNYAPIGFRKMENVIMNIAKAIETTKIVAETLDPVDNKINIADILAAKEFIDSKVRVELIAFHNICDIIRKYYNDEEQFKIDHIQRKPGEVDEYDYLTNTIEILRDIRDKKKAPPTIVKRISDELKELVDPTGEVTDETINLLEEILKLESDRAIALSNWARMQIYKYIEQQKSIRKAEEAWRKKMITVSSS